MKRARVCHPITLRPVPSLNLGLRLENPTVPSDKSKLYEKRSLDNRHIVEWLRDVQYCATPDATRSNSQPVFRPNLIYNPFAFNFLGKNSAGSLRQGRRFVPPSKSTLFFLASSPTSQGGNRTLRVLLAFLGDREGSARNFTPAAVGK